MPTKGLKEISNASTSKKRDASPVSSLRTPTRAEQVISRLHKAAEDLFMEKGYDATSMAEIAGRAKASKETIYRHFRTKDDLFRSVVVHRAEMMSEALETALPTEERPEKALTVFGEMVATHLTTDDSIAFHRVLGIARERFPEVIQLYRSTGGFRVRDALARYLEQQAQSGRLRSVDSQVAARQFFDLVVADLIINASLSGKGNPGNAVIKKRVHEAVDCFLHGYVR